MKPVLHSDVGRVTRSKTKSTSTTNSTIVKAKNGNTVEKPLHPLRRIRKISETKKLDMVRWHPYYIPSHDSVIYKN